MPTIKNPNAPATDKQKFKIRQLMGGDELTKKQASNLIQVLEMEKVAEESDLDIPENEEPFEEAKVTIVEGDQRSGKTCTGVARLADNYFNDCVRIFCRDVLGIVCVVRSYDRFNRTAKIKHNGQLKLVSIPEGYKLKSPMRIFANIHLFGLPYVYCPSFRHILHWLKIGLMRDGWLLMDEAHVGINARSSMSEIGQEMEKQSFQYGKAMLNVIIITHIARMIDWTARTIPTERLHCTFDKKTYKVTYSKKKKGETGNKDVTYYAPQYFPFFWTNERINA